MSKYGSPSDCIIVCNSFDMRAVRPTSDHLAGRKNSRSQLFDRANISASLLLSEFLEWSFRSVENYLNALNCSSNKDNSVFDIQIVSR